MPKEKVTRGKGKKADAGKKKKGMITWIHGCDTVANSQQTPTRPSVVSPPTCSSPTSSATRSARRTPASSSVRANLATAHVLLLII